MSGPVLGFIERQKEKLEKQKQERDAKQRREAPKENPNVLREALDRYVRWLNADSVDEGARFNMMSNPKGCVCPELELTKIIRGKLPNLKFTKPEVCVNESETTVSLLLHCKEERSKTLCSRLCALLIALEVGGRMLRRWGRTRTRSITRAHLWSLR